MLDDLNSQTHELTSVIQCKTHTRTGPPFFAYLHYLHVPVCKVRSCEAEVNSFDRIFHLAGCLLNARRLLQVGHC